MNKRIIFTSMVSLMLAFSMIFGATYALFTSESQTNIAVTSGTVDVNAAITLVGVYSPTAIGMNGVATNAEDAAVATPDDTFYNGGSVKVEDGKITLTNMTPGDKATFKITMTNDSNVDFMQRLEMACTDSDKAFFNELLFGMSDTVDGPYTYYSDLVTNWESDDKVYTAGNTVEKYLTIEMPGHVKNTWQGKTCNVSINVKAVQGNASVVNGTSTAITTVATAAELATAVADAADGATIYVTAPIADAVTITTDAEKTVTIRGYDLGVVNVTAANATIHLYNDAEQINGDAIAHHSLYLYGEVAKVDINVGRVVVAAGAVVDTLTVKANASAKVTVDVPAETSVVREIIVDGAEASEIQVNVSKEVAEAPVVAEAETNEGTLTEVAFDKAPNSVDELIAAIDAADDGDVIVLSQNIVFTDVNGTSGKLNPLLTIKKNITLDMNGMTMGIDPAAAEAGITGMPCIIMVADGAEVVLKNGTIDTEAGSNSVYGIHVRDGKLTIESGNYHGAFTAVQVTKGELVVNGGTFALSDTYASYNHANIKYMINCVDANYNNGTAVVKVYGGTFVGFNPADNAAEGIGTSFVVSGYAAEEQNGVYTVAKAKDFVVDDANKILSIGTAAGLRQFASEVNGKVNSYANWSIKLLTDIDLAGENWTPINGWDGVLNGATFDGQGFSIRNMKVVGGDSAGFISNNASSITIKNVTFENAYVETNAGNTKYAGVVMGKNYSTVTLEGIKVVSSEVRCQWQSGGLVGFAETNAPAFVNCSIEDSFVGGSNCTAGAFFGLGIVDVTLTGCTAKNVELYTDMDPGYVGYIYGHTLTTTDCVLDNVTVVSAYPAE